MVYACVVEPDRSHNYTLYCFQGYKEPSAPVLTGFTPQGGLAVLINSMQAVGQCIQKAEYELSDAQPSLWLINGNLYSAANCLKGILDGLANYCQQQVPLEEFEGIEVHFAPYRFQVSEFAELQPDKLRLEALTFGEKAFHAACNELKHNGPWVGNVSLPNRETAGNRGRPDIYKRTGFVHEFMVPAYKYTCSMLTKLARNARLLNYSFPQV